VGSEQEAEALVFQNEADAKDQVYQCYSNYNPYKAESGAIRKLRKVRKESQMILWAQ
jgi:hypothetical protein